MATTATYANQSKPRSSCWTTTTTRNGSSVSPHRHRRTPSPAKEDSRGQQILLRTVSAAEDRLLRERIRRSTIHVDATDASDNPAMKMAVAAESEAATNPLGVVRRPLGRWSSQPQLWKLETKDFIRESDMDSFGSVSEDDLSHEEVVEAVGPLVTMGSSVLGIGSREQPMFSTKAHVFHIDPKTKRSWIPASSHAVAVSFFFDASRNLYRIISVEGTKAVINSTITPSMTFTKTSQKFGQWSDIRANTVYGLGFQTEPDLNQFIEKFQEVKEKTRVVQSQVQKNAANGGAPGGNGGSPSSTLVRGAQTSVQGHPAAGAHPGVALAAGLDAGGPAEDSPKHKIGQSGQPTNQLPQSTVEAQLRYENDRLKLALAQSSANAKKWEVELQTLKNNNARLTGALQESTANVEEWKRQLHALKDENTKMRCRELEIEASHGSQEALTELGRELAVLRQRNETLDAELRQKDKEIETLRAAVQSGSGQPTERHKAILAENDSLRMSVSRLQEQLEAQLRVSGTSTPGLSSRQPALEQLSARLESKVSELHDLQAELAALVHAPPPPPQASSAGSTPGPS